MYSFGSYLCKELKRSLAILFLSVIVFQCLSGLYVLGYFYYNKAYISKNVCINRFDAIPLCKGKCFLNKKLKAQEQNDQKLPNFKQNVIQLFCENSLFTAFLDQSSEAGKNYFIFEKQNYPNNFSNSIFHPPQAV